MEDGLEEELFGGEGMGFDLTLLFEALQGLLRGVGGVASLNDGL